MLHTYLLRLRRTTNNTSYLPEVDGIRFLAISMVVLFHLHAFFLQYATVNGKKIKYTVNTQTFVPLKLISGNPLVFKDNPNRYAILNTVTLSGDRGVELFFVLSGFILALPFAKHYLRGAPKVSLRQYYLRRLVRIEPPYLIALSCIFVLGVWLQVYPAHYSMLELWQHFLASLAYLHLFIYHRLPMVTTVAWSLEIEVQFYLIAPLLFMLFKLPPTVRRGVLLVLLFGTIFFHHYYVIPALRRNIVRFLPYFLTGLFIADAYVTQWGKAWFEKRSMAALLVVLLPMIVLLRFKFALPDALLFPVVIGLLYYLVLMNPMVKPLFSIPLFTVIGGMCYSIYLWHYTIIAGLGKYTSQLRFTGYYLPNLLFQFVALGGIVLLWATLFFVVVERPFMAWRNNKQLQA